MPGCRANIIVDRSDRVLEILPESYPFLLDDPADFPDMMDYAASIYGGVIWNDALRHMERIRKDFTIERHMKHYFTLLDSIHTV